FVRPAITPLTCPGVAGAGITAVMLVRVLPSMAVIVKLVIGLLLLIAGGNHVTSAALSAAVATRRVGIPGGSISGSVTAVLSGEKPLSPTPLIAETWKV